MRTLVFDVIVVAVGLRSDVHTKAQTLHEAIDGSGLEFERRSPRHHILVGRVVVIDAPSVEGAFCFHIEDVLVVVAEFGIEMNQTTFGCEDRCNDIVAVFAVIERRGHGNQIS